MSTSSQEPLKCPIRINLDPRKGPIDTEEEVAEKWEAIKKWYMDHPGVEAPWTEWVRHQREWASFWEGGEALHLKPIPNPNQTGNLSSDTGHKYNP